MDIIRGLLNQIQSLSLFLHINTNLKISLYFDEGDLLINVRNNNQQLLYSYSVEKIGIKKDSLIEFELKQIVNYLINLKVKNDNNK